MLADGEIQEFQDALLGWFDLHKRALPWRRTSDPYAIWVSEVMLQQTRVAAVIPFYEEFLRRFPTLQTLAHAPEADLLAHWAGLGYYHRARSMQKAAQKACETGAFPETHEGIRALPGVGEYTSAAVASIAFHLPVAAVDGNVLRVLARVLADATDIGTNAGKKHFSLAADALLARERSGDHNQAMMELGATVCLPKNPQCLLCPVARICRARNSGRQNELPVKLLRKRTVQEERVLFWIERNREILLWQRPASMRLMPGFWELPEQAQLPHAVPGQVLGAFRHGITFHDYGFEVRATELTGDVGECQWMALDSLSSIPASTILRKAQRAIKSRSNLRSYSEVVGEK
ncbi:MAG: A/G-specific adenine glycosylase [Acidobacteriota bacterium]|nr:A/G-specific adenine glycosylase [Acidobacteriota bacterium]